MKLINKLLVLVFLIFLVIIFIETYYLYAEYKKTKSSPKSLLKNNGVISEESVEDYKSLVKNKIITSSVNKTRYEGKISSIREETTGSYRVWRLTLQNESKTAENDFFFLDKYFDRVKISDVAGDKKEAINFKDLKVGDSLIMIFATENVYDTKDPRYLIECTIDRVEK